MAWKNIRENKEKSSKDGLGQYEKMHALIILLGRIIKNTYFEGNRLNC
jgi:hypothetical protein